MKGAPHEASEICCAAAGHQPTPAVGFRNPFARRYFPPRPIGRACENNSNMLLDDGSVVQLT
jgi:hypothetical protein